MSYSEIAACLAYAVSVWLAARNNVHTWWIGIIGSILYGWVFGPCNSMPTLRSSYSSSRPASLAGSTG